MLVTIDFVIGSPFRKIIFEGNAFSVINLICNSYAFLGTFSHVIDDIKSTLSCLKPCKLSFIRQKGNEAAHTVLLDKLVLYLTLKVS